MSTWTNSEDAHPFPFGVSPEAFGVDEDGRGADTISRLLMHGARYHDREAPFYTWGQDRKGWDWQPCYDWRADRHTVRAALVLRQRLELQPGESVALWFPLGVEWALVERGAWSIGVVTVPVWPDWSLEQVAEVLNDAHPTVLFAADLEALRSLQVIGGMPESVRAVILMRGPADENKSALPFDEFMEYGGVLDTAERAAQWRTLGRELTPDLPLSLEYVAHADGFTRGAFDHRTLVETIARVLTTLAPQPGRSQVIATGRPDRRARALVYAGWTDGLTRTFFLADPSHGERARGLQPDLIVCDRDAMDALLATLAATPSAQRAAAVHGSALGDGDGRPGGGDDGRLEGSEGPRILLLDDPGGNVVGAAGGRVVHPATFDVPLISDSPIDDTSNDFPQPGDGE